MTLRNLPNEIARDSTKIPPHQPTTQNFDWPQKKRDLHSHHFDSTIWDDFQFRDGDIIIATYAKSGTTWIQQIIAQLMFAGDPDLSVAEMSPWLDLRVPEGFIHKGVNGRWSECLTEEECAEYERVAEAELGPECARWLAEGGPCQPARPPSTVS